MVLTSASFHCCKDLVIGNLPSSPKLTHRRLHLPQPHSLPRSMTRQEKTPPTTYHTTRYDLGAPSMNLPHQPYHHLASWCFRWSTGSPCNFTLSFLGGGSNLSPGYINIVTFGCKPGRSLSPKKTQQLPRHPSVTIIRCPIVWGRDNDRRSKVMRKSASTKRSWTSSSTIWL